MLTNTLKKLIYFARNSRKPNIIPNIIPLSSKQPLLSNQSQQPTLSSSNQQFSHHLSPTLKKIQKRYNSAVKQQQKSDKQMMKGFHDFQKYIVQDHQRKRLEKQKKYNQTNHVEDQLKKLQIPKNIREKIIKKNNNNLNNNLNNNNNNNNINNNKDELSQSQLQLQQNLLQISKQLQIKDIHISRNKSIKSQQQAQQFKKKLLNSFKIDQNQPQILRQDILLDYISKNSKNKQINLNLTPEWKRQLQQKKKQKQQQQSLINQKIRYQKLTNQIQQQQQTIITNKKQKNNILTQRQLTHNGKFNRQQIQHIQQLKKNPKISISQDQIWRSKYPSQLIQQALQYKNKQLKYFKQLIQPQNRDIWDFRRDKTFMKSSEEEKQRYRRNQQMKKQNKQIIKSKQNQGISIKQIKQQQGLQRYQDQEYFKEKALKQFQEKEKFNKSLELSNNNNKNKKNKQSLQYQSYDQQLKSQGQSDLQKGDKLSQIFIDDFIDQEQHRLQRKQKYQKSTFGKYQIKLKDLSSKLSNLGFQHEFQDLALLSKRQLFAQKKIRQENQQYQQYLLKKQKKNKMKEQLKKIHKQKLRQDLNFDYQVDPVKLQQLNPADMQQGLKKLQQLKRQKQSLIVSQQQLKQKIHHTKTLKSMSQFINGYFYNRIQNINNNIHQKIQIGNIYPNKKNTVLNIFWKWKNGYLKAMQSSNFTQQQRLKQQQIIQAKLTKQRNYISSKMTMYLGLRYGPDIRFYYDEKLQQTKNAYDQIVKYKNQIVQISIDQYKQKGIIKTIEQENQYRRKLLALAESNLEELNNQKKIISKNYKKKEKIIKKLEYRKQQKERKQNKGKTYQEEQNIKQIKKKYNDKQKDQIKLNQIIGKKVQQKKKSIFQSSLSQEQMDKYFGDDLKINQNNNNNKVKRNKKSSVDKMWDQINKL